MQPDYVTLFIGIGLGICAALMALVLYSSFMPPRRLRMGDDVRLDRPLTEQELRDKSSGFVAICHCQRGEVRLALRVPGGFLSAEGKFTPYWRTAWDNYGKTWRAYSLTDFDRFETEAAEDDC